MNLCRCERGHFYDKEKYATCPHCAGGSASDESLTAAFTEDANMPNMPVQGFGQPQADMFDGRPLPGADVTEPVSQNNPFPIASMAADMETVSMDYGTMDTPTVPLEDGGVFDGGVLGGGGFFGPDDDNDHTIGFFDSDFEAIPGRSSAVRAPEKKTVVNKVSTPCVGWLIALGGEHVGTDFRLKVGKNFVGRSPQMDVALTEDKSVSRDRHAIVVYEPKAHLYLVQPGESSSLVYRNNEVVLTPVKLEAYDMITVGDVNLLFIPLCGERFNWSDLLEEMKKKG